MKVHVTLFARARDLAGTPQVALELAEPARIADVRRALAASFPQLDGLAPHLLMAIGTNYAGDDATLSPDAEVACFPPVSGG